MRRAAIFLAAAALLILGACGTGEDPGLEGAPPEDTSVHTIEIEVVNGKPVGGVKREEVDQGETVQIAVSSDVADEIHVHGYNKSTDVSAGGRATLSFNANIPGVFEVELEQRKEKILELEVK